MKEEYISSVLKQIKSKSAKRQIAAELESHIADKIDYYVGLGYFPNKAEQKAVDEMGSAEETASSLAALHDVKWYKKSELWFSLALIALQVFLIIFYPKNFRYTDNRYSIIHFITIDFVSLLIFAADVLLIHFMRKRNNKLLLLPLIISLVLGLLANVFEPALYALAVICTKGFSAYTDSIFGYSYTQYTLNSTAFVVHIAAVAITVLLLVLSLWTAFTVHREQLCQNVRSIKKLLCISEKILICFLALNLAAMSVCTVIAVTALDDRLEQNKNTRGKMIKFYVNSDTTAKSADEIVTEYEKNGYSFVNGFTDNKHFGNLYYCNIDNACFVVSDDFCSYGVTTFGVHSVLNRDLFREESDFDKFKRNMQDLGNTAEQDEFQSEKISQQTYKNPLYTDLYSNTAALTEQAKLPYEQRPYTLNEFLNDELSASAFQVDYITSEGNPKDKLYQFYYELKSPKNHSAAISLQFCDGMLVNMTTYKIKEQLK